MRVSTYFLHLVLTFTPHYIITDKGLLPANIQVYIIRRASVAQKSSTAGV